MHVKCTGKTIDNTKKKKKKKKDYHHNDVFKVIPIYFA